MTSPPDGSVENLTLVILREIRDEIRGTNTRLDHTNARLDHANARLDDTNARLDDTKTELGVRLEEINTNLTSRLEALETATIRGFEGVRRDLDGLAGRIDLTNQRLDGLRDIASVTARHHARRLDDLEQRVCELEAKA